MRGEQIMTLRERAIIETYTGKCMLTGKDRDEVYKYMTELMGRPVYRHELSDKRLRKELQARSLNDFVGLCRPPQTNADRIRNMTDEELAELISSGKWACICPMCEFYGTTDCAFDEDYGTEDKKICAKGVMKWLQSPVEV